MRTGAAGRSTAGVNPLSTDADAEVVSNENVVRVDHERVD